MKKILALTLSLLSLVILFVISLPSDESLGATVKILVKVGEKKEVAQDETPWFNESWHYRRPVIIANSGEPLIGYQVLITVDNSNFDFNQANTDGSDIRITANDGLTEVNYWIESWDSINQLAYIWVRVPVLENGNTLLYMYYSNSEALPNSNGSATFDFFDDDWSQFPEGSDTLGLPWLVLDGGPKVETGALKLIENTGIRTFSAYQYKAVGYRANFGLGDGQEWGGFINGASGQRTMIRDLPLPSYDPHDLYLQDYIYPDYENKPLEHGEGNDWHSSYHVYEVRWQEGQSIGDIDHGASSVVSMIASRVPTETLPVTFYSFSGSNATLWVDWVYVREYRDPEPTVSFEAEQGLVDLGIKSVSNPDSLYQGDELTYELTISNTSSIDAPGVILTDTLPAGARLVSVDTSQGTCIPGSEITCDLDTIAGNSTVNLSVVVTTTLDGYITNTATVSSPSYDLNSSNNTTQTMTTVLPSADLSITMVDEPDPVRASVPLTYTITISNNGPSDSADVVVTDTLPAEVVFKSAEVVKGSCTEANPVICDLGKIDAGADVELIVAVTTPGITQTTRITNTIAVGASTFDPITINDIDSTGTLVDGIAPEITWTVPVQDEHHYITYGGMIPLRVNASDNDQVDRVEFKLWDHIGLSYVIVGVPTAPPYEAELDSELLVGGELYQMWAVAVDRAGNRTGARIYIIRNYLYYYPFMTR